MDTDIDVEEGGEIPYELINPETLHNMLSDYVSREWSELSDERRFRQHAEGSGAKYFRGRRPEQMVYVEQDHTRSSASKRELQIKATNRAEKDQLLLTYSNQ